MTTDKRAAAIAALIVRDVAEIPDRCSPDDQPEMMLVTSGELTDIVMRRLAAPHADDEARIAEILRKHAKGWTENDRLLIDDALLLATDTIRCLAAGKAKAEAEAERLTGVIDDTTNTEATNADTIADLRAKLAEAEKKKDAFFQRLSEAMETLDHIRDNHVQGDDVSDHEGIAQAVDRIAAERDAAVAKLADAERQTQRWKVAALEMQKQRDAALAAQNARAVEELEKVLTLIRDEWREADTTQCLKSWVDGWLRDRLTVLGAVVDLDRQTEPAAEPVPAAADANRDTDDEVLRDMLCDALPVEMQDVVRCVRALCRRVLEVRP